MLPRQGCSSDSDIRQAFRPTDILPMKLRLPQIIGAGIVFIVLMSGGFLVAFYLSPSVLAIHPPNNGWQSITVDGNPVTATSPQGVSTFVPIIYGYHTLTVKFSDGSAISALFFHDNTGVDRRVDISIERHPGSKMVQVREVINWHETIFSGAIRITHQRLPDPTEIEFP
jgi:hypothetical protein